MLLFRIIRVFLRGVAMSLGSLITIFVPLAVLVGLSTAFPLEWQPWVLAILPVLYGWPGDIGTIGNGTMLGVAAAIWISLGALFLKYQLYTDDLAMRVSRKHDTPVDVEVKSLHDLFFQTGFAVLLGPLVLLIRSFQRPTYGYVSTEEHYRTKLFYTAGRMKKRQKDRLVFDSKSYLFGQFFELLFWGAVFYLALFENGAVDVG